MQCNIDARGKAVRLVWGLITLVAGLVLVALLVLEVVHGMPWWVGAVALLVFGAIGIFEARAGWCMMRAMGFKTPV